MNFGEQFYYTPQEIFNITNEKIKKRVKLWNLHIIMMVLIEIMVVF